MSIEERFIPLNIFFSNLISILMPRKLGNDFLRPITFQPVTILDIRWVNCYVQLIENFEGSFYQIIVTNTGLD